MSNDNPFRAYRAEQNLTIAEMATELQVSRVTAWRWEKGERRVARKLRTLVSEKTGIPVGVLASFEGSQAA